MLNFPVYVHHNRFAHLFTQVVRLAGLWGVALLLWFGFATLLAFIETKKNTVAKVEYNQILPKRTVIMDDDPYIVLSSNISKKDRQKASNNVKMKNLRTGGVVDRTFHQSDVLEEADIEKRDVKFLYENRGAFWFCEPNNPRERFELSEDVVGEMQLYVRENTVVEALVFDDTIMSILTPIKVELTVTEAPDAVKGNTSSGATKEVTLETGLKIQVPQFIAQGDVIAVNTDLKQYTERVSKA